MTGRIYWPDDIGHHGRIIRVDGTDYTIDAVETIPGEPGCEPETVAYLTPLPVILAP